MTEKFIVLLIVAFYMDTSLEFPLCRPQISIGNIYKLEEGGFIYIECDIASCDSVVKIQYEKATSNTSFKWIPVFEGYTKTNYSALNTSEGYSLANRNDYTAFHSKHILHIGPLTLKDDGKWRCVVYCNNDAKYKSDTLHFNVYVTPPSKNMKIIPLDPDLLTHHRNQFTCTINGIHPEPEVVWMVDGEEHYDGTAFNKRKESGLWLVKNINHLMFDQPGLIQLTCLMKTKVKPNWVLTHINIDVKASANILQPQEDMVFAFNINTLFTLNCTGTGHHPIISWGKDGKDLLENDSRFSMQRLCNASACASSLTFQPVDPAMKCVQINNYRGVYTCTIKLEQPYKSKKTSPIMNVINTQMQCDKGYVENQRIFVITIASLICLALMIVCLVRYRRTRTLSGHLLAYFNWTIQRIYQGYLEMCSNYTKMQERDEHPSLTGERDFTFNESMSCMWGSRLSNFVYSGGRTTSSITVIDVDKECKMTKYPLTIGMCIQNGLAIDDKAHIVQVQQNSLDNADSSDTSDIFYVRIYEQASTTKLLIPKSNEKLFACCIFSISDLDIGVYSIRADGVQTPEVHIFNLRNILTLDNISSDNSIVLKGVKNPSKHDYVCTGAEDHIYLSSWLEHKIYIHNKNGLFITSIGSKRGSPCYLDQPCHIQCFEDNSLVVVCKHSIQRYDKHEHWSVIQQFDNRGVSRAATTKSRLLCLYADDNRQVLVYNMNF